MNIHSLSSGIYPPSPTAPNYGAPAIHTGNGSAQPGDSSGSGQVGTFVSAILQALSQSGTAAGITASTSAGGTGTSAGPLQALDSFLQTLIPALQTQSSQAATPPAATAVATGAFDSIPVVANATTTATSNSGSGMAATISAHAHHGRHGGRGKDASQVESNLQSLIQQLSSSSSTTAVTSASGATAGSTTLDSLQQSFQALSRSMGNGSGSASTSLGSFLQAFSRNLEHMGRTGTIVNTQA